MYRKKIYERYLTSDSFHSFGEIEKQFNTDFYIDINTKNALPLDKNAKILDIGCGFGRFLKYLNEHNYTNIQGLEIGEEQNQFLRGKGYKVLQKDIFDFLKHTNEKYDFVSMFDVLEHFTKTEIIEILPLLKKILNENGTLLIRVPNGEAMFKGSILYGDFTHETFFTSRSINQIFNIFEYKSIKIYPVYPICHGLKSTIRNYIYKLYEYIYKAGIVMESGSSKDFISTQNILGIIKK